MSKKISAVCCTYGRFTCVERVINCFLAQSHSEKELVLFNTASDHPYIDPEGILSNLGIKIINNSVDFITGTSYTNVGAIRRDALTFAEGDYVVTWDDDDIFLPFFMEQAVLRMEQTGLPSFKPEMSFFYSGNHLRLVKNTLEASVIADIKKVREYGYLLETGKEGLGWYTKMRDHRELDENDSYYLPSYCFNWQDGYEMNAPHKQSGDINNPENFENHKAFSLDHVNGRILKTWDQDRLANCYAPYFDFIRQNSHSFPEELISRFFPV